MTSLPAQIVAIHEALAVAALPHAFGGALALAWCTQRARGTIDIDVNVFVRVDQADTVIEALPATVKVTKANQTDLRRDGQVRLWWDGTPLDLFLNTTDFHEDVASRVRWEQFAEHSIPFLSCDDLAVFKAFFNRTQDWADLEQMYTAGTLHISRVTAVLVKYLGVADERIERLQKLAG